MLNAKDLIRESWIWPCAIQCFKRVSPVGSWKVLNLAAMRHLGMPLLASSPYFFSCLYINREAIKKITLVP